MQCFSSSSLLIFHWVINHYSHGFFFIFDFVSLLQLSVHVLCFPHLGFELWYASKIFFSDLVYVLIMFLVSMWVSPPPLAWGRFPPWFCWRSGLCQWLGILLPHLCLYCEGFFFFLMVSHISYLFLPCVTLTVNPPAPCFLLKCSGSSMISYSLGVPFEFLLVCFSFEF